MIPLLAGVLLALVAAALVLEPLVRPPASSPARDVLRAADGADAGAAAEALVAAKRRAGKRYCPECGAELEGSGKFCVECGKEVG